MALIKCPECGKQVSSTAASCPHCGAPIAERPGDVAGEINVTTTQETSKSLKRQILISAVLFWGGMVMFMMSAQSGEPGIPIVPALMNISGLFLYIATKARTWWHHG